MTTIIATNDFLAADKRSSFSHGSSKESLVVDKLVPLIPNKVYIAVSGGFSEFTLGDFMESLLNDYLPKIKENDLGSIFEILHDTTKLKLVQTAQVLVYTKDFNVKITKNGLLTGLNFKDNPLLSQSSKYSLLGSGTNIAQVCMRLGLPIERVFEIVGTIDQASSKDFDIIYREDLEPFFDTTEEVAESVTE